VGCVFVGRAMSDSGDWCSWVGVRVGLGIGERAKKTYYLVGPFEIADFRGE
jgi:hypothetical protein